MSPLIIFNVFNWALQTSVLLAVVGGALALMRVSDPRLRLSLWRGALLVAFALPFLQRWRIAFATLEAAVVDAPQNLPWNWGTWVGGLIVFGVVIRLMWLVSGFSRLRRLRIRSAAWMPQPSWYPGMTAAIGAGAALGVSADISSAVTFGVRRPSILVPAELLHSP